MYLVIYADAQPTLALSHVQCWCLILPYFGPQESPAAIAAALASATAAGPTSVPLLLTACSPLVLSDRHQEVVNCPLYLSLEHLSVEVLPWL